MKKVILSLAILLFAAFTVNAQTATPTPANPNAPVITFAKTTHDYGTVTKGADGSCEFTFKNTGVEPLILQSVNSSCGCTVPEWPRDPVLKGKSATIKVKYDTNRIGGINKTITVISNGSETAIQLHIIGNVVEPTGAQMPQNTPSSGTPASK